MGYEATIQFTLDTICPWTYLAKRRLETALSQLPASSPVTFTTLYKPYQLYPEASEAGEDKYAWYQRSRYPSDEQMKKYTVLMSAYGAAEGIDFKFGGLVANTLHAHRLIQHLQSTAGPDVADKVVRSLYKQYFEEERHPSSEETLMRAAMEAGVGEEDARRVVEDKEVGLQETKEGLREAVGNQVDSVPRVVMEGRRRDIELEGAKTVEEYVTALNKIVKESS
ncbi:uncharacterized protein LTR77_004986 [Saxophila tyrrhenica]|uniref:DSBA-like thioredoxin domain-containing protein n=1 Tax=Saxophila tyrrhenica TaxID=1690608 RepID=A0AAV9PAM0_9PEZI|nr:hypothetical protein LTR77_004986 [Saxophila tyrrhenica]